MNCPPFLLMDALKRNLVQRLPEYASGTMLGHRVATKKTECPRVCIDYLTDITTPFSASRDRRVQVTAHVEIVVYSWIDDTPQCEERILDKFADFGVKLGGLLRDLRLGRNCPDGFTLLSSGEMRGATASTPVNSTSRIVQFAYDFPSITFEALIGED